VIAGDCAQDLAPLRGMTLDGAYRILLAFRGGHRALKGRILNGIVPSEDLHDALAVSLAQLPEVTKTARSSAVVMQRCADSLAEQRLRGVSHFDRTAAGDLLKSLGMPAKWRNMRPLYNEQLDLFR
jgi:hypothetical protein